jgi:hypothetical protein
MSAFGDKPRHPTLQTVSCLFHVAPRLTPTQFSEAIGLAERSLWLYGHD